MCFFGKVDMDSYIVLDLEWNQSPNGREYSNNDLPFEIIEIGAVKLDSKLNEKGLTIVPLKVYLKGSLVKVEIGLARGKKNYDKRETLAKKTQQREIEKAMKRSMR